MASEEAVLELVKCKCLPILLHGLECCSLNKSDVKSLDFAAPRFLTKLFKSVNVDLINECRYYFYFSLPSELLEKEKKFLKNTKAFWSLLLCHNVDYMYTCNFIIIIIILCSNLFVYISVVKI